MVDAPEPVETYKSFIAMSWNIEGLAKNIHNLKHFINIHLPDLIFISEPMVFQHDIDLVMMPLRGEYNVSVNSADKFDPELPLVRSRAHGGTMALWKLCHDPYISIHPVSSCSILPIIFSPPGSPTSIHVSVYLPTHGQESAFLDELSNLSLCLDQLLLLHPESPIFLRGDFNVSERNPKRTALLNHLSNDFHLLQTPLQHKTYHHFLGEGKSDSNLDKLLFSDSLEFPEVLVTIHCKLEDPRIDSHHDMLISSWSVPVLPPQEPSDDNITAPKIENNRTRVVWTDSGIENYQHLVIPELERIQQQWLSSSKLSKTSISLLCESTNNILSNAALMTNKAVMLNSRNLPRSTSTPLAIRKSANKLLKEHKRVKHAISCSDPYLNQIRKNYVQSRSDHRRLVRSFKAMDAITRDEKIFGIKTKDPGPLYRRIKSVRRGKLSKIKKLKVGDKVYLDEAVCDGFFDSISSLKSKDVDALENSTSFDEFSADYQNILKICEAGSRIPQISENDAFKIIQKMKPNVNDYFGITPNHYNYAGPAGWKHFHLLLSILIDNVNSTDITEINIIYACILFKGHGKDKQSARSYRTISTCPVIAKALDLYIRDLHLSDWNKIQAECQFQGEGSSHEVAAVLVTECIQHSLHHLKSPLYVLYLDAKSAFDVVMKELLVKNLYHSGTSGEALLYLNNRLGNRQTILDWDGQLMGPIMDEQGVEQGGVNSSDFYKVFGKEQLATAQESGLGVTLGPLTVGGVGLADDTALLANNIHDLLYLLHLTNVFCSKYHVNLCSEKTKLQVYQTKNMNFQVDYVKNTVPVKVNEETIHFTEAAEHVGMVRSVSGNLPTILARFTAHKNALGAVLHTGMARSHRCNPAASLHVHTMYAAPVLFSGIAPLVLSAQETNLVNQQHKETLRRLQRLLPLTPQSVTYFLAGSLPGSAILHLRQLSIFGMITRLEDNIINNHARNIFNFITTSSHSWFNQIRDICLKYGLPHPLKFLESPLTKHRFKTLVKKSVVDYWEKKLRAEAAPMDSLLYFHPKYMSLSSPHPLWTTAGSSPTQVSMASVQSVMLSGRYRTEGLCSHWSSNPDGFCRSSSSCNTFEDITHILQNCRALAGTREKLSVFTHSYCEDKPDVKTIIDTFCSPQRRHFCQFLLDCSVLPEVINSVQLHGQSILHHLFCISRMWCFALHRDRLKILGRWSTYKMQ